MLCAMMRTLLILSLICLTACSQDRSDADDLGEGGVSVREAKALDEAAEMIEARQLPVDDLPEVDSDPEAGGASLAPQNP